MNATPATYPCPCCGYLVFDEPPGGYDICGICGWEDDAIQLRWPDYRGGANGASLLEHQAGFARRLAEVPRSAAFTGPEAGDRRDPGWRPIDLARDSFEQSAVQSAPWPGDRTELYWWRPTFWRRDRVS